MITVADAPIAGRLPQPPMLPVEQAPPGEAEKIEEMIAALTDQLIKRYVDAEMRRDAHPKTIGLVKATFTISNACPDELQYGVFAAPGRTFDAMIRFSNGAPTMQHDLAFDVRGMAVKLTRDRGDRADTFLDGEPDQDFMLATAEAFFGTNAVDYVGFIPAAESVLKLTRYFVLGLRFRGLYRLLSSLVTPASPLALDYFSQTPYRLGPHCVKYRARPVDCRSAKDDPWYARPGIRHVLGSVAKLFPKLARRAVPGFDCLRMALAHDLENRSFKYEFLVQRWPDLRHLPTWAIEDGTRTWPARWERVADIEILPVRDLDASVTEAEPMTFTPWHAMKEHQPLGSINRARFHVYKTMSTFRNKTNRDRATAGGSAGVSPTG
jgi:hypothetical protein